MKLWPVLLLVAVGWVHCMTVDNASTKTLRSAITSDELEITIRDLKPRKTGRTLPEVLLAVDFPHAAYRFTILLDWTSQTVVLETTRLGQSESKQAFALPNLDTESFVSSLILHVRQERPDARIEVYENCELRGTFHTNTTFRDAFESEDDHKRVVKVYRDRRMPLSVDGGTTLQKELARVGCHTSKDAESYQEIMQMQADGVPNNIRRGDIPIMHSDCDDLLVQTLIELIAVVKHLRGEVEQQKGDIHWIRNKLEQCDICNRPEPVREIDCTTYPCFHGVHCTNTARGPICGPCPRGYIGDGRDCRPGLKCDDRPCFENVQCYDTPEGAQCGPCPSGYEGDGRQCRRRGGCEARPCSAGVQCVDTDSFPYYRCGSCPAGFTGNGTNCRDLDECDLAEPCDPLTRCYNLSPGYRCDACPAGYRGGAVEGVGIEYARRNRQRCEDIDECQDGRNGGCVPNSECINTEGSFRCGHCMRGYHGDQNIGCHKRDGVCPDGTVCDENAECRHIGGGRYRCKCKASVRYLMCPPHLR